MKSFNYFRFVILGMVALLWALGCQASHGYPMSPASDTTSVSSSSSTDGTTGASEGQ